MYCCFTGPGHSPDRSPAVGILRTAGTAAAAGRSTGCSWYPCTAHSQQKHHHIRLSRPQRCRQLRYLLLQAGRCWRCWHRGCTAPSCCTQSWRRCCLLLGSRQSCPAAMMEQETGRQADMAGRHRETQVDTAESRGEGRTDGRKHATHSLHATVGGVWLHHAACAHGHMSPFEDAGCSTN